MRFFVLKPDEGKRFGRKWAFADLENPNNRGEAQQCPVCGGAVSGLRWLPPHRIALSSSKPEKWGDFMWGAGFPLLVSERFKDLYESESLRGIAEFSAPVEIVRLGKIKAAEYPERLPVYHLIHVPWGGANQDDQASGLVNENPEMVKCLYCRAGGTWRKQGRVALEEGSWDGSDIFKPRNSPVNFVVSERFKEIVERNDLKNVWLIPIEKFGFDVRNRGPLGIWYVNE